MNIRKSLLEDQALLFVVKLIGTYACWSVFHHLIQGNETWKVFTNYLGHGIAVICAKITGAFGLPAVIEGYYMRFPQGYFVAVKEHCLALPAMFVFTGTIMLLPGKWKSKLWFIPMGLAILTVANFTRIVVLSFLLVNYSRLFFDFIHSWVYVAIFYGIDMVLMAFWINRFAYKKRSVEAASI